MTGIAVNVVNAFLCGVINGFIDAVIGLATLIKWLFGMGEATGEIMSDLQHKLPTALEVIDNLLDAWKQFSFKELFSTIKKEFVKFIHAVFSELEGGIDVQTLYHIAYFAGNAVGFLIEFIIELLATGGVAAVTKFFESFAQLGTKITAVIKNLLDAIFKISVKDMVADLISGLRVAARFFSATAKDVAAFIARLFEEIKTIFGIGLPPATEELFEKLGLTWKSKLIPRLNSGLPTSEKIYQLYHEGMVVFIGNKREIEEFTERLAKLSEKERLEILGDLANRNGLRELMSTIGSKPMEARLLKRIITAFEKRGGKMLVGTEDAIEYLKYKTHIEGTQVFGVTLNENLIYLEAHPATSTVYEELIHSAQFRTGKYNEWVERYGNRIAVDMMEKEAAEKLIANASAWKIPAEEVEMIKKRLKIFSKNLKNRVMKILVKGGLYLEAADIYILTIKFVEGDKILPGQKLINSDLSFTVKSLTLGTYNYETDSFDVVIEKPNAEIKDLINKEFDLAN